MKNTILKSLLAATTIIASAGYATAQDCDATFTVTPVATYSISCEPLSTADDIVAYEWTFGDETLPSLVMVPTHTYGASGTYTVCLTVTTETTSCMECTSVVVGDATSTGDVKLNNNNIRLYPNPATNHWSLDIDVAAPTNLFISITDVSGRIVKTQQWQTSAGNNTTIITNDELAAGLYLVSVNGGNASSVLKAAKQ